MVPISGIVTWKSESTSRRKASNSSSARSISSIRSTGGAPVALMACKSGRLMRKGGEKMAASFSDIVWGVLSSSLMCRSCLG